MGQQRSTRAPCEHWGVIFCMQKELLAKKEERIAILDLIDKIGASDLSIATELVDAASSLVDHNTKIIRIIASCIGNVRNFFCGKHCCKFGIPSFCGLPCDFQPKSTSDLIFSAETLKDCFLKLALCMIFSDS